MFLPIHARPTRLTRRTLLLAAAASAALAACGGDDDTVQPPADTETARAAREGVSAGLVGLAVGSVRVDRRDIAVAGRRRLGRAEAIQPGDTFGLGSNTKAMSAAAIAALIDRGVAAWTTPLSQVFPLPAGSPHAAVTLGDLLDHRAGLLAFNGAADDEVRFLSAWAESGQPVPATIAERRHAFATWLLTQAPPGNIVPGRDFFYSNAGYAVAASIVETLAGEPFEALFETVLTRPLGLAGTWHRASMPPAEGAPAGHEGPVDALVVVDPDDETRAADPWLQVLDPAGSWHCTPASYADWLRWHLLAFRGGPSPLAVGYVQRLMNAAPERYAVGWQSVTVPTGRLWMHTGHLGGFMAEVAVAADGSHAAFAVTNTGHMSPDGSSWVLTELDRRLGPIYAQAAG
ncbi:serine hydrolase [Rhizobacter sp. Root1221]|uniref:serine hydrolase domain-containing protein n=1 Tax=Rhizobacter sp. Root1221 TaxID=1736433 RepID=UPI000B31983E|nr:serine hydrolase domain-containing protein [Rhizobacter sp. Root1221]